jgi:hypothetical protein
MFDTRDICHAAMGAALLILVTGSAAYACTDDPTCGGLFTSPIEMPDYREDLFTSAAIAEMQTPVPLFTSAAIAEMQTPPDYREEWVATAPLPISTLIPPPPPMTLAPAPSPHPTQAHSPAAPLPGYGREWLWALRAPSVLGSAGRVVSRSSHVDIDGGIEQAS